MYYKQYKIDKNIVSNKVTDVEDLILKHEWRQRIDNNEMFFTGYSKNSEGKPVINEGCITVITIGKCTMFHPDIQTPITP